MLQQILGNIATAQFFIQMFWAMIGVAISLLLHANNRDQDAPSTPTKFSLSFLIKDNWKRIMLNLLLIFVTIRFFTELTGIELIQFYALLIGICWDKLAELIKAKTSILDVKR